MQFRRTLPLTLFVGCAGSLFAQTPVTFSTSTSTSGETPANIYSVDVNNDGLADVIQDTAQSPAAFTVSISNGNGSFKAPVQYSIPISESVPMPIAAGDFNNDGKVDLAVVLAGLNGTGQIAVYLGNGDGTFQTPRFSNITLPSGSHFSFTGPGAADFNGDAKLDLAVVAGNGTTGASELYVLAGDGTGGFAAAPYSVFNGGAVQIVIGDFDSDGKADIALTQQTANSQGNIAGTTISVLYGNNNFTFANTTAYSTNTAFTIASGDLNSDGFTDLFGFSSSQLGVFYGASSRTFSSYFSSLPAGYVTAPSDGITWQPQLAMGDFNGDGRMDLVAFNYVPVQGGSNEYLAFFLAGANPGEFTTQLKSIPASGVWETAPVTGLFSGNYLTPDVTLNQSPNGGSPPQNTPSYLLAALNRAGSGYFGPCYYPKSGEGFNVCSPGTASGSTATFNAAVNSFGKMRKIELWVDGKKVSEQYHVWDQHGYFSYSSTFAAGSHTAAFFAADVDNRLQSFYLTFVIAGGTPCNAPSAPGVNICTPANNSTVSSPVTVQAAANITGSLSRMELWIDGTKFYTETTSTTLTTSYPLAAGKHQFGVYAVNTAGTKWLNVVYATVP